MDRISSKAAKTNIREGEAPSEFLWPWSPVRTHGSKRVAVSLGQQLESCQAQATRIRGSKAERAQFTKSK